MRGQDTAKRENESEIESQTCDQEKMYDYHWKHENESELGENFQICEDVVILVIGEDKEQHVTYEYEGRQSESENVPDREMWECICSKFLSIGYLLFLKWEIQIQLIILFSKYWFPPQIYSF